MLHFFALLMCLLKSLGFGWTMKNSNQGAAAQLWAALDPEWEKYINDPEFSFYSKDCHIAKISKLAKQKEFGKVRNVVM